MTLISIQLDILCFAARMACSRRLPPTRIEENLDALLNICPEYADDLLGSVDQPLKLLTDKASGREYLACDYNRDGDSYRYSSSSQANILESKLTSYMLNRSPWSNEYDPPLDDGTVPSTKLRRLEIAANDAFDTYREMCVSMWHNACLPMLYGY
jgi:capping protein beta